MLGGQLRKLYPEGAAWDREEIDATDFGALGRAIAALQPAPEAIVNCIAFNDVDGAEDDPAGAFLLNAEVPGELARLAAGMGIPLVHYSTNYVFDGGMGEYAETDRPAPLSVYGRSKRGGEERVAAAGGEGYVVRTAVLFGPQGESGLSKRSFVELMLGLAASRDTVEAVQDEVNSVTYAPDLAAHRFYVWLNRYHWLPSVVLAVLLAGIGGFPFLLWGVCFRIVFGLHATWLVNSATHLWGARRFATHDDSRNNWWVALLTFGEGWHNNHHAHPTSARHGLAWYEFDPSWMCIRLLRRLGVATAVHTAEIAGPSSRRKAA